jgi:hypothetical protein
MPSRPQGSPALPVLPYRKPTRDRDYWVFDHVLPDPDAIRERCLAKDDWVKGHPYTSESWPGMRTMPGLEPDELAHVEKLMREATGARELWLRATPDGGTSFFRQSLPGGRLGGNLVAAPHNNLVEALGTRFVPPDSFTEDVRVTHRYNRLLRRCSQPTTCRCGVGPRCGPRRQHRLL